MSNKGFAYLPPTKYYNFTSLISDVCWGKRQNGNRAYWYPVPYFVSNTILSNCYHCIQIFKFRLDDPT